MSNTKRLCFTAMMIATGILLPMAFHAVPNAGAIFAPMHLPVFIAGILCGPVYGGAAGVLCPLLSFLFTGMPAIAMLPNMLVELLVYGTTSGLFFRLIRTKSFIADVYIALVLSMLLGRVCGGITALLMFLGGNRNAYSWSVFFTTYFVTCWPAILIQIFVVPTVVIVAKRARFIGDSDRYLTKGQRDKTVAKQREFFNGLADGWRDGYPVGDEKLDEIFAPAEISSGDKVLDAGCGTGVLDGWLLRRGCFVDAIDVSDRMIARAKDNPDSAGANFTTADFYEFDGGDYDKILVFDAYPHFTDRQRFAAKAHALLKEGGTLYIAFDEGGDRINSRHRGAAGAVSGKLLKAEREAQNFKKLFKVFYIRDDDDGYCLGLRKREVKKPTKSEKIG